MHILENYIKSTSRIYIFIFAITLVFLFHRYGEEDTGRVYMPGAGFYCEQPI